MLSKFCQQTDIIGQRIKIKKFVTQGNLAETVKKKHCIAHSAQKRGFPNFFRLWSEALEIGEFLGELLVIS